MIPSMTRASVPLRAPRQRRLLFVSYSHRDAAQAREFREHLALTLDGLRAKGTADWDVFFDAGTLQPGEKWGGAIADALDEAQLFVFLLSKNSLGSPFCVEEELATAVRLGVHVVPVLLSPCDWTDLPLPNDADGDTIASLGVLPKDPDFNLVAVADWPHADAAWTQVVRALRPLLQDPPPRRPPLPTAARRGAARHVPPLLPYLCNQKPLVDLFDYELMQRRRQPGRALLVLVKGTSADEPKQFWNRLREEHLTLSSGPQRCLPESDLDWPRVQERLRDENYVRAQVAMKLSKAFTGNQFAIDSPPQLATHLAMLDGVRPVVADFPPEPPKALKATLTALLDFLEACPEGADLSRLVVVVLVVDTPELVQGQLVRQWKLQGYTRCQVVEFVPMAQITPSDATEWHADCRIGDDWNVQVARVLQVFGSASGLRAGPFADAVRPLLAAPG